MIWPTHLMLGLIIGKITGNYPASIISSLFMDLDHLWIYYNHSVLFNRKFFSTIINDKDLLGKQRNFLHSLFMLGFLALVIWLFFNRWFFPFLLGSIGHMLLDFMDRSELMPFFPLKFKTKGFIGYMSKAELVILIGLTVIYLII